MKSKEIIKSIILDKNDKNEIKSITDFSSDILDFSDNITLDNYKPNTVTISYN